MGEREKIGLREGDVRYQRRNEDGTFSESDDQTKSLCQDVQRNAEHKKPRNEGD